MSKRVLILTVAVMCVCRAGAAERWLIERAPAEGLAADDRWQLAAADLLVRNALARLRGVTLVSKEDVASDVATLELSRVGSAKGDVRVTLGKYARATGLIVFEPAATRDVQVSVRVIDLTSGNREETRTRKLNLDDIYDIVAVMHSEAIRSAEFLGRVVTRDEVVRMQRFPELSVDALKALGKGIDARDDAERARFFKQATVLSPEAPLAWYLHARQLHSGGENLEAISAYRRAVNLDGEVVAYHYDLGNAFFDERRYCEAEGEYRRAIELDPSHAPSHGNLIRAWKALEGKPEEMLRSYAALMGARFETTSAAQLEAGRLWWEMGKPAEAVAAFRKAAALDASDPVAQFNLAHALEQSGKPDEAVAEYKRAVELAPNYAKAHNNLAFLYEKRDRETLALFHYQQAVKFAPDYALAWNNLGILYGRRGMHRLEVEAFRRQVRLTPKDPLAHFNLGVAYHRTREYRAAIECYKKSLELKPDDKPTHWQLAQAYERASVWNLANDHWRKVLSLDPTPEEKTTAERHIRENAAR
ncbi:MAG TPA: tetratricopeptide repeat protein [Planctomycetota bacterium]|nr:tetratricopeptide repeat protein [Planctomycetota bacterium]